MYKLPQNAKLNGVKKIAAEVDIAVRLTDRATFPFAMELIKFEILPPGQAATKIIPKATVGVGLSIITIRNEKAGNRKVWLINPTMADFGFFIRSVKCSTLISSATPNMTKAKAIFKKSRPEGEKLSLTWSRISRELFIG
jgi:hypothetical protein